MDGNLSDGSFNQRAKSLGWKTRLIVDNDNESPRKTTSNQQPAGLKQLINLEAGGAMDRKQGESRRTTKRQQEVNGGGGAPTTDITALMDNYFFFNAAHAATASKAMREKSEGLFNGHTNIIDGGKNGAYNNPYRDNEELESRFVRTLEWVGEASRAISPSSASLSREAPPSSRSLLRGPSTNTNDSSRSLRGPSTNTNDSELTNGFREIMSNTNEISETNGPRGIANFSEPSKSMDASISRDIYTGASFHLPPSAISRGEVHATSFRTPKTSSNGGKVSANANANANSNMNLPPFRPSNAMERDREGPSATCKLPCQSCGNGPSRRGDNNHNHDLNHNHNHNGESFYTKPNYAMGHYDRNDRLAKSAYHNPARKVHPNDENFLAVQKVAPAAPPTATKNAIQHKKKEAASATTKETPAKADYFSSATKVQQWFSKLIGKGSKTDQAKSSKSSKPAAKDQLTKLAPNDPANQLAYGTTMHDVLTNKANVVDNHAPKPQLEEFQQPLLPSVNLQRQAPSVDPKPRAISANSRSIGANSALNTANYPPNPAPIGNDYEEARGSSRRFIDDARMQRFGYGSKSERWAPLHLNQQKRQAKDYQDKQRLAAPLTSNSNTNHSRSARSSPSKQQLKPPSKLVDAKMYNNHIIIEESSSPVKRKQQIMNEDGRNPPRFTSNQESKSELVQLSKANNARQGTAEEARYGRVVSANLATKQERGDNPRAFIANYASQSERFSSRHARDEARRSINRSARTSPDGLKGATKGGKGLISANDEIKSITPTLPPPPADDDPPQDRDIEVLNDFLIRKKENLQHYADHSRLHVILSGSSLSSMVSALCYAWILQNSKMSKMDGWERLPVMNMPRNNMWNHKQLAWLFQQAGLDTQALLFIDEVDLETTADSVGEYRISTIGQDIVRIRGEVASYCTIIAEQFFKEIDASMQAKCIRILLLAGLLIDTENLDFINVFFTRRDELAASSLLPGAGHKGRAVLLAELKQDHETQDFYDMMCKSYGKQHTIEHGLYEDAYNYLRRETTNVGIILHNGTQAKHEKYPLSSISSNDNIDFFSEDASTFARTKSTKSYSSVSTSPPELEKSRLSPTSPPPIDRIYVSKPLKLRGAHGTIGI